MSIGIKGSGEAILETHQRLDKLIDELEDISTYWNGKDETFIGGDGEIHHEEQADCANEAVEMIKKLRLLLEELDITY